MMVARALAAVIAITALAGCGSSAKTYFYTLQAPAMTESATQPRQQSIVVGPIRLPESVDRAELVTRSGETQVVVSDTHQWSQPLKYEIARALAANLARDTNTPRVTTYGKPGDETPDLRITLDILRFESVPGTAATIEALWTINPTNGGPARTGRTLAKELVTNSSYDALVAAHGRALAQISHDIAAALRQ